MLQGSTELKDVLAFAPEWEQLLRNWQAQNSSSATTEFLNRVGARAIYCKALTLDAERERFLVLLQNEYYQPMLNKMLGANQNLRRFLVQRRVTGQEQRSLVLSQSLELAQKMVGTLVKQLSGRAEDGFKALLPAYVQRSVHNAVIDYIRQESAWERQTLQDVNLDPQQDDPRTTVADDIECTPERKALSGERIKQLNEFRRHLRSMLTDGSTPKEALTVVDCMFGLGLTPHSVPGQEMTMRECCDKLKIEAETMARRIARCQVLLDKGLDLVRSKIYKDAPGIAETWQRGLNVNTASRRELSQQLALTEGEIDRLIRGRQYYALSELIERAVIKENRLPEIQHKGAVAAFVPVDVNSATARDIIDVLGLAKETAQKMVSERPFKNLEELVAKKLLSPESLADLIKRGGVARTKFADSKRLDLNKAGTDELEQAGITKELAVVIIKTRPYLTWSEVEDFVGSEQPGLAILRQKFFLGLSPG